MTVLELARALQQALDRHPDLARRPVVDYTGNRVVGIQVHNPEGNGFTQVSLETR